MEIHDEVHVEACSREPLAQIGKNNLCRWALPTETRLILR